MKSISVTQARKDLYNLMDEVSASSEPVHITGPRSDAVLVSASDWASIQETLYLQSVPGMREAILEGMATPVEELIEDFDW